MIKVGDTVKITGLTVNGADKRLVLKKGVNQNNGICNYSYSTGWMLSGGQAKEALIASGLFAIAGAISFKK